MKNICFINGSPKTKESNSLFLLNYLDDLFDKNIYSINTLDVKSIVRKNNYNEAFQTLDNSNYIILAFPLYVFSLPGIVIRFFEEYYNYIKSNQNSNTNINLYCLVNCGFLEPEINKEAIEVIKHFCIKSKIHWRFGISIGGGEFLKTVKEIEFMQLFTKSIYNSLHEIINDVKNESNIPKNDFYVRPSLPKTLFYYFGKNGWKESAKLNNLTLEDLYRQPFLEK